MEVNTLDWINYVRRENHPPADNPFTKVLRNILVREVLHS